MRLASQLIGWQIDLYSSRDWMERGGESGLFGGDDEYEMSDFPLSELEGIAPATLAALEAAGISSFYGLLDMDRSDFLQVPGIGPDEADTLEALIDELTVVDEAQAEVAAAAKMAAEASAEEAAAEAAPEAVPEVPAEAAPAEVASADAADAMSTAASGEGTS